MTDPEATSWQPIATVPTGEHVLLWFPRGESGAGGMECATVYRDDDYFRPLGLGFWTHGGAERGTEWSPERPDGQPEKPTHWMRLPSPPDHRPDQAGPS